MQTLMLVLMLTGALPQAPRPADPLQRYAVKLLRDSLQHPEWKLDLCRQVLARDLSGAHRARRTTFCPRCDSSGVGCDGSSSRIGTCAASSNIRLHSIIWLESSGFMLVTDRGGGVTVHRGMTADFDEWLPDCEGDCWTGPGTIRTHWALIMQGDGNQGRNSNRKTVNAFERAISTYR